MSLIGELAQAFDQMAASLEHQTQHIQTRTNQVTLFSEFAMELAVERNISELHEKVLVKVMKLLNTSKAALTLYDPAADDLVVIAEKGLQLPIGKRINMGDGSIGRAAQTCQPVIMEVSPLMADLSQKLRENHDSIEIQIPMVYRGDLVGVLGAVTSSHILQQNQEDLQILILFAEQAAGAIKNARLFEDTHRRLHIMETVNEISSDLRIAQNIDEILPKLLEKTISIFNANMGSIWLYDPSNNGLHKIVSTGIPGGESSLGHKKGIIEKVFSSGQPEYFTTRIEDHSSSIIIRSNTTHGISGACIPIRTSHAIVGVLVLGFHARHAFSEDQKQLITTIAEMAGNAIHRIRLHEQTVKQLKRLSALHQIDLAVTSSLDLRYTLQILLDQVITQLGVDAACALTYNPQDQALEYAASRGFTTDALRHTHLPIGQGYAGLAAKEQRTIFVADLNARTTDFLRSPSFSAEGFVTYYAVPLVVRSQIKGVLEVFHRSRLKNDLEWLDFLEALASQAAIAIENAFLYRDLQQSNMDLNLAYDATLEGWSRALDLRDKDTEGHTQRVTEITLKLARAIGISEADIVNVRRGAMLHDIGKLGVPDHVLLKPSPLTEEEWTLMRLHPIYAYQLLSHIPYLRPAIDIPYCHHEKWDGSGYPRGLKGEEIPLSARIFSIVDVWDALRSDRPYRKGLDEGMVREYLRNQAGHHFDPKAVNTFLSMLSAEDNISGGE